MKYLLLISFCWLLLACASKKHKGSSIEFASDKITIDGDILLDSFGIHRKDKRAFYQPMFNRFVDSVIYYSKKFRCAFRCDQQDSMSYFKMKAHLAGDSVERYYTLMYPEGNPEEKKEPKSDCDCQ